MIWLIDDAHLGRLLRGEGSERIGPDDEIATSGLWYLRLCQAVADEDRAGALSSPFDGLEAEHRSQTIGRVLDLPDWVGLPSLRHLAPLAGRLRLRHSLNLLALEAVAAAVHLDAYVLLSTSSPRLESALAIEERPVVVDRV